MDNFAEEKPAPTHDEPGALDYESSAVEPANGNSTRRRITRRVNNITAEAVDSQKYFHRQGRILLYSAPYQRQKWGESQVLPLLNWGDLLFDLFYVSLTYNVSLLLTESPNFVGLLYAAGTFFPAMSFWIARTYFDARFVYEGTDVVHRLSNILLLCILGVAVLYIRPSLFRDASGSDRMVFALMLVLGQLYSISQLAEVFFRGVGQQQQLKGTAYREGRHMCIPLLFYVAALIVSAVQCFGPKDSEEGHRILATSETASFPASHHIPMVLILLGYTLSQLLFAGYIIFCFPPDGGHKEFAVPINIGHTIHRNGEWTMLMLGESIFSLLIVQIDEASTGFHSVFFFGVLTIILLQILHFQSEPHRAAQHAARRSKNAGILYSLVFQIYSLALVILGAAFTFFLLFAEDTTSSSVREHRALAGSTEKSNDQLKNAAHMFSGTLAVIYTSLDITTLLHLGVEESRCRLKHSPLRGSVLAVLRVCLIVFIATLSQWQLKPTTLAFSGCLSVLAQLVLRKLGLKCMAHDGAQKRHEKAVPTPAIAEKSDSAVGESAWPNVTHARAEKRDEIHV